ncbi:hypothetical protein [Cryobacterium arcticum]|uniref:hypothetical protein n=1 Tax=Cryobacterium arcticum TaxID=670052 RepID=UPI0011B5D3B2|nr:hypothetical protein [Cryobacterium arcticum]
MSWNREERFRPVSSPVGPLAGGVVLLVCSIYLTGQVIINWDAYTAAMPGKQGLPYLLWLATIAALALGLCTIGPRRRYLAATTPAQRAVFEAELRVEMRLRRAGLPPAPPIPDAETPSASDAPTTPAS